MARAIAALLMLTVVLAGYAASPFLAAWNLREAIKAADTKTIERKVVWDSVRASIRSSLAGNAELMPEAAEATKRVKPSVWQRVKTAFGQSMVDRFVETYVTPEGLPKLFRYQRTWNGTVRGKADEVDSGDFSQRVKAFYGRMIRAEFKSPMRIEFEMADRGTPGRHYISVMELHGFEWKLAELRIVNVNASKAKQISKVVGQVVGMQH